MRNVEHFLGKDRAHGADGIMPVEALADETVCRMLHGIFLAKRNLIFDDEWIPASARVRRAKIRLSVGASNGS